MIDAEEADGDEIDHEYTALIVCPHCGHEQRDSWEWSDEGEDECEVCEKPFTFERIVETYYSTRKNDE